MNREGSLIGLPFSLKGLVMAIRISICLALVMVLSGPPAWARSSAEERRLKSGMGLIDKTAASRTGEQAVIATLAKTFRVGSDQVKALHARQFGFGEIAALFAVAGRLDGGLTQANVNKIADLRQGNAGWVQISRAFDIDLASASQTINDVERDVRERARRASSERAGSGAGGVGALPSEGN